MKTTMKKLAAYLLAMLMIVQILPAVAEYTGEFIQGDVQFRDMLEIKSEKKVLMAGRTVQLSFTEGYNEITWTSDSAEVATVENGEVTAVAPGRVKITATEGQYSDSILLQVVQAAGGEETAEDVGAEETEAEKPLEKLVIIITGNKDKVTYNGEEQTAQYTVEGNREFDKDKLSLKTEEHLASGTACGIYKDTLTADDFEYEGEKAEIIVTNGWLQIKPIDVTVKADDITVQTGGTPEYTATVTGALNEEDEAEILKHISYTQLPQNGVTYIVPESDDQIPEGYQIKLETGVLTFGDVLATLDITEKATLTYNKEPQEMDPNQENSMTLTVAGLDQEAGVNATTKLTLSLPENIKVTARNAATMRSDDLSAELNEENKQLVLSFKGEVKPSVTATLTVIPDAPATTDLSGTYAISNLKNNLLTPEKHATAGRLCAMTLTMANGKISLEGLEDPAWVITHVTGNYYTVRSKGDGRYLTIKSNKAVELENATEETATKILFTDRGGSYSLEANSFALNNYNLKVEDGYGAWTYGGGDNEKFKLLPADFATEPTVDVSGQRMLYFDRNKMGVSVGANGLQAMKLTQNKLNHKYYPTDDLTFWTFEHITRDWYYVSINGEYLNVDSNGSRISNSKQPLLVRVNGDKVYLTSSADNKNAYTFKYKEENSVVTYGSNEGTKWFNEAARLTLLTPDQIAYSPVNLSGSWVITSDVSGGALLTEAQGNNLKAAHYYLTGNGEVFVQEGEPGIWTFTKVKGNWYTVQNQHGQYLSITDNKISLSSSQTQVFIHEEDGKYRLTNGDWALNAFEKKVEKGYGAWNKAVEDSGDNLKPELHTLRKSASLTGTMLIYDANGGSAEGTPATVLAEAGEKITLPNYTGSNNGKQFIGWSRAAKFYDNDPGLNHSYHELYKPGTTYTIPGGTSTLYAVWDNNVKKAEFYIRLDGIIQDEPGNYQAGDYTKNAIVIENAVKEAHWVIDLDGRKGLKDYYIDNNVVANLSALPTVEQITNALAAHKIDFDPETQYIHFYVMKYTGNKFNVDGVIHNKDQVALTYNMNVPAAEKTKIKDMPGGTQVDPGTETLVGTDQKGKLLTPERQGYVFKGWNTEADGTGTAYNAGAYLKVTENTNLYAQWTDIQEGKMAIMIVSEWPSGKPAYIGAEIELKANLTGFENKSYTLQWQYTIDHEEWIDVPGANQETMTYRVDETTGNYFWRVVAKNVKDIE